jgi:hypothetical protein
MGQEAGPSFHGEETAQSRYAHLDPNTQSSLTQQPYDRTEPESAATPGSQGCRTAVSQPWHGAGSARRALGTTAKDMQGFPLRLSLTQMCSRQSYRRSIVRVDSDNAARDAPVLSAKRAARDAARPRPRLVGVKGEDEAGQNAGGLKHHHLRVHRRWPSPSLWRARRRGWRCHVRHVRVVLGHLPSPARVTQAYIARCL